MKISLVSNRNIASAARDLVPTSKRPLPFTNCTDQRALITCDVTDEGFAIIILGKRVKPRIDLALVPDFEDRYLENEKRFFKNNFETVF